jgi:hypothetical protein
LRTAGLLVRLRAHLADQNQLIGYAIALPGDHNAAGDTIWYSRSKLAPT